MTDRAAPAITAPVSRFLAVADVARSVAFYRDILGFSTAPAGVAPAGTEAGRPSEVALINGPARILIGAQRAAVDSTGEPRPRGSAMIFFETDDVDGMRERIRSRGGNPTEPEKVNWIKYRVFQIRDPDGHTLWFGKSFQEPDPEPGVDRQLRQALPELPVSNVPEAIAYYQKVLGFKINYAQDDLGVMYRDEVTLLLIPRTSEHRGIGSCYAYVRDADALHAELTDRGARVQGKPVSQPWGLRDFSVRDLDENRLTFGQSFE
jgi:catechol 2,3-dioxygenase-like lactoylglutathione lyase family enzyme